MLANLKKFYFDFLKISGIAQKRCIHCMAPFFPSAKELLCRKCEDILSPYTGPKCRCCGIPIGLEADAPDTQSKAACGGICLNCERERPLWRGVAYHGLYTGALRDLCLRLKFDGQLYINQLFAQFILEACKCLPRPDILLSIPQHPVNLVRRGYNQAHELAKALARLAGLNVNSGALKRIRPGRPQEGLTAMERRANLRQAFRATPEACGRIIWLIDDVMTTGSTYAEACSALLEAGAKEVYALFVARTPLL